ncbi:PREDICTED: uncharacterized protein LOC104607201 [Nelumbo nucifera]|uniref:Uncharacterized protein LOC104607201 n=1 Tax=Nelumbo nucifera TaxID=4432 RepID=A0A1U8AWS1_NELNU|nr:PREDICTED: uncharacterized protein LOC104607201 [Nelumbo nucifera]
MYVGDDQVCQEKFQLLLREVGLPSGLLRVKDAEEYGYIEVSSEIKKLTGMKAKELLIWVTVNEIYVDDPPTGMITFNATTDLTRTFPVSAFEIQEGDNKEA